MKRRWKCALLLVFALAAPCALALNPALDINQYGHFAWRIRDGFLKGAVRSIAQTADGYLWLGTEFGLYRFDGVRPVAFQPPRDQHLPSDSISALLAARDGTLWIGTYKGLASWKDGKLNQYPRLAGQDVPRILEDREGAVWAGGVAIPAGRLCQIQRERMQCYGEDGLFGYGVFGLFEDRRGDLWAGALHGIWHWKPGPPKFHSLPNGTNAVRGFADEGNGTLLVGVQDGILRFADGKPEAYPLRGPGQPFYAKTLLRDRDGGIWIGTGRGLLHSHEAQTDWFGPSDGLSGDDTDDLFEDREGNVWVATPGGLDRFRDFAIARFSENQGVPNLDSTPVLAARDGSIWVGTGGGLIRLNHADVTAYTDRGAKAVRGIQEVTGSGLPTRGIQSLFQDSRGRIWIAAESGFAYLEQDRWVTISGVPSGYIYSIAEDAVGNVWLAHEQRGLLRLFRDGEVEQTPWARLARKDAAGALAADLAGGGVWIGFYLGDVIYFADGEVRKKYTAADGLGGNELRLDRGGTLWAATEGGLSRLKDGRVATLASKGGLPCDAVHWVLEDDDHSFWLSMVCGLVRISQTDLEAWSADPAHTVKPVLFDNSDGVISAARASGLSPRASKSQDGRLWFTTSDGLSVIDPRHLPFNKLLPPVQIEKIVADSELRWENLPGLAASNLRLPALTRDLQTEYTALSFVAPEKVRFSVKLEGHDPDWKDAGTDRKALYNDLPPRRYRFRVMAANHSGVWNEAGASLDFSIDPAYYQTTWFLALCAAGLLAILAGLYQLRLRYLKHQFNVRLESRVGERTRIARDLHDTMLQSFQGSLMNFHALTYLLQDRPEALKKLENCIEKARAAVAEGRDAVQGLRSSTVLANDLARAISTFGGGLAGDQPEQTCPEFRVQVEGKSRDLPPLVRDEVYRIACESLRNAFRHAQAKQIEVEIRYAPRQFRLCVADNGKGIDPQVLSAGGRAGHHGLPGIHERAELAGGKLVVRSKLNSGTEIELTIPATIAYRKSSPPPKSPPMTAGEGEWMKS